MGMQRKSTGGAVVLFLAACLLPGAAVAIDVDIAKKCNMLMEKQFPPRQTGNPAAGSAKGNAQVRRDYFKKCVDNGGNVDDGPDKNAK